MKEQVARQGDADLKRGQGREPFWVCYLDGWTLSDTLLLSRQTILENSLGRCRWWCKKLPDGQTTRWTPCSGWGENEGLHRRTITARLS